MAPPRISLFREALDILNLERLPTEGEAGTLACAIIPMNLAGWPLPDKTIREGLVYLARIAEAT